MGETINTNPNNGLKSEFKNLLERFCVLVKWLICSFITGILIGLVGVGVVKSINWVTAVRTDNYYMFLLLPVAGLITVFLYQITGRKDDIGTNAVLDATKNERVIHITTAPLIIISTVLTHLAGGSSGREGAALQFGGALGEGLGKLFKFTEKKDKTIIILAGMSAAFSAVFGLPVAAAIFPMEVVTVGVMHYSAFVPCAIASLTANRVAILCGCEVETYTIPRVGNVSFHSVASMLVVAILSAIISMIFCFLLHYVQEKAEHLLPNAYLRVVIGSAVLIGLTFIFGTAYNGLGGNIIKAAIEEEQAEPLAFALKMLFTVITLSVGFKGGEIVPSFFIGATFGCVAGHILGFSPSLCAALGLISVFCGATNCPVSSLLIAYELFGSNNIKYFLAAIGVTYVISGYFSLYHTQEIAQSKT